MRSVPNRTALTAREETMNGIWRSPKQKPKPEIQSEQKTTTSTPNIISDRCPRLSLSHNDRCYQKRQSRNSAPSCVGGAIGPPRAGGPNARSQGVSTVALWTPKLDGFDPKRICEVTQSPKTAIPERGSSFWAHRLCLPVPVCSSASASVRCWLPRWQRHPPRHPMRELERSARLWLPGRMPRWPKSLNLPLFSGNDS